MPEATCRTYLHCTYRHKHANMRMKTIYYYYIFKTLSNNYKHNASHNNKCHIAIAQHGMLMKSWWNAYNINYLGPRTTTCSTATKRSHKMNICSTQNKHHTITSSFNRTSTETNLYVVFCCFASMLLGHTDKIMLVESNDHLRPDETRTLKPVGY